MPVIKKRKPGQYLHWKLRAAGPHDMSAVCALLEASGLPTEDLGNSLGDNYVVAEKGGRLLGVAGVEVHGSTGLVRSVAVAPEQRGHGLGERLLRDRLEWARANHIDSVFLLTMDADGYFVHHGFVRVSREEAPAEIRASSQFTTLCPSSAVLMRYAGGEDADESIRDNVRSYYARAAKDAQSGRTACCGGSCDSPNPITSDLYAIAELKGIPDAAVLASLGCGNPVLLAELHEGETVLDLGSGGGIDVLLSARRVGATGKAYGLDMTDEMLKLARENQRKAGVTNVEFLKGQIEAMPLPDASIDVIISNCVINLAADKRPVLREAFRVLKHGGRFAVSDIVVRGEIPPQVRRNMELWAGCVSGALEEHAYRDMLKESGFENVEVVPTRIYTAEDAGLLASGVNLDKGTIDALDGAFMSAFVRARKP